MKLGSTYVALLVACATAERSSAAVIKPTLSLQRGAIAHPARLTRLYAVAQPVEPSAQSPAVAWGVCGFLTIIGSAIGRLTKVAVVPAVQRDITLLQWGLFGSTMAAFAYYEGYKAFQLKFSPMLVQRAMTLSREGTPAHHIALAPFYSMGLFHATKKCAEAARTTALRREGLRRRAACAPTMGRDVRLAPGARSSRGAFPRAWR